MGNKIKAEAQNLSSRCLQETLKPADVKGRGESRQNIAPHFPNSQNLETGVKDGASAWCPFCLRGGWQDSEWKHCSSVLA